MIYFTADQHFFHDNIIRMRHRPFANSEEMNEALIKNWNDRVNADDEVFILGDVTMHGQEAATYVLRQLRGRKYLIVGNHDLFCQQVTFDCSLFEGIQDYYRLEYKNDVFVLFHYPILEWDHFYRGSYHLHGHKHNAPQYNEDNARNGLRRYDVGGDANNMAPVSVEDILYFFTLYGADKANAAQGKRDKA